MYDRSVQPVQRLVELPEGCSFRPDVDFSRLDLVIMELIKAAFESSGEFVCFVYSSGSIISYVGFTLYLLLSSIMLVNMHAPANARSAPPESAPSVRRPSFPCAQVDCDDDQELRHDPRAAA